MIWNFFPITLTKLLTAGATEVNEGGTSFFTLSTKGVTAGTQYAYAIKGVSGSDLSSGSLAGTATVGADGKAIIAVPLANDTLTEGDETMTLEIAGQSAPVTVKDTSVSPPVSINLTAAGDNVTGTPGNDAIVAAINAANQQTLTTGDSIDGGAGTDSLDVVLNGGYSVLPGMIKDVENITISNTVASSGINMLNVSGVKSVTVSGATATTSISNISDLGASYNLVGSSGGVTLSPNATKVTGTADEITVNLTSVSGTNSASYLIETVKLNVTAGTGGSWTQDSQMIVAAGGSSDAGTLSITGDSIYGGTIDLSAYKGATSTTSGFSSVNITGGEWNDSITANATSGTGSHVIAGNAGNDTITIGAIGSSTAVQTYSSTSGNVSVSGGAGNDTVTFVAGFNASDTVDGGDGIADTISFRTGADFAAVDATYKNLTNFERVSFTNANATLLSATFSGGTTTSLKHFGTGVNRLTLSDYDTAASTSASEALFTGGQTTTINFNAGSSSLFLTGDAATTGVTTLAVAADGTATTDALSISFANYESGVAQEFTQTSAGTASAMIINATGIETLTLTSSTRASNTLYNTFGAISVTGTGGANTSVVITGTSLEASAINANSVDASGMTVNAEDVGLRIGTGGNGILKSIVGSAGADSLSGSSGNDTITGGGGNDTILAGAGVDSLSGGAGNDTFLFSTAADFTTADVVDGGDGTDAISITSSDANTISSGTTNVTNITNVEALSISDALANNINVTRFGGLSGLTLAHTNVLNAANAAVSNLVSPATVTYTGGSATTPATDTLTPTLKANGAADTLTVTLSQSANAASPDYGNLAGGDFETVAITSSRGSSNSTTTSNTLDLTATSGTTAVTIGGAIAFTSTISSTVVSSIDASANTGGVNITATASAVGNTIVGTATGDTLIAGAGSDNISGGDGNDSISGGAGADTIQGGAGEDTLDGGAGIDSIDGGGSNDTIYASAGADNISGGDGTDTYVLAAAYTNVSGVTLTSVEVLNAGGYNFTIAPAQLDGLTSVTSGTGTATLSAASTSVTSKSGLTKYQLASGTNSFTQRGLSSDEAITVTGGTGADTINISSTYLDTTDSLDGGAGSADVLNVTGNTAIAATDLDNVTNIEQILFNNTSTSISVTAAVGLNSGTGAVTIDASGLTSGTLTFSGGAESVGSFIVVGGAAGDTITGSDTADVITGGLGADSIVGRDGGDVIDLGSDTAADVVRFNLSTDGAASAAGAVTGYDVITNFVSGTDKVHFDANIGVDKTGATTLSFTTAAASAATNINLEAAEAVFISKAINAASGAVTPAASLANSTTVAATIEAAIGTFSDGGTLTAATVLFVVESSDTTGTYGLYLYTQGSATDITITNTELLLLGIVTADAAAATDIIYGP